MAVRILRGNDIACFFCSTSDWAFGPVFAPKKDRDADERAQAFLRWLNCDPRPLPANELERQYVAWLAQEDEQFAAERAAA
jgi:hypothetical protein